jgi:hypothetical protein
MAWPGRETHASYSRQVALGVCWRELVPVIAAPARFLREPACIGASCEVLGASASALCCHDCGLALCRHAPSAPRPRAAAPERAARAQDVDEGYNDEMAGHGKEKREREPMMPPTGLPAHFSMAGTAEHAIVRHFLGFRLSQTVSGHAQGLIRARRNCHYCEDVLLLPDALAPPFAAASKGLAAREIMLTVVLCLPAGSPGVRAAEAVPGGQAAPAHAARHCYSGALHEQS